MTEEYRKVKHGNSTAGRIYDSSQRVKNNPFEHTEFNIGVFTCGTPFNSAISGKLTTDVQIDTVSLWSNSYGTSSNSDELPAVVTKATRSIIRTLDTLIAELSEHRDRLQQELERIEKEGIAFDYKEE